MPYASKRSHPRPGGNPGRFYGFPDGDTIETFIGNRITPQPNGCWQYLDGEREHYAQLRPHAGAPPMQLHRWVYELLVGPIPDDHHLHHECENKRCVNPAHLTPLTPADHRRRHTEMRRTGQ